MFDFELLPSEMQLEILKRTEFRTVQNMKRLSKSVKTFIQQYRRYIQPVPIRQMLVTPDKISFTLESSCEVWTIDPEEANYFLQSANIQLLWLEAMSNTMEPISLLKSIVNFQMTVNCLKLGSSRTECDLEKLEIFMKKTKCSNLIVDWRFFMPINFFEKINFSMIDGLTIGEQTSRYNYNSFCGQNLENFKGTWLEIGTNRLEVIDFLKLIQRWQKHEIKRIEQYNIVINFPMINLAENLRNCARRMTSTRWITSRGTEDKLEQLEIIFYLSSMFVKHPSVIIRQIKQSDNFQLL